MSVINLDDASKARFLTALESEPREYSAAKISGVPIARVKQWYEDDPDFNLACQNCKELLLDELERKAVERALEGSEAMLKFILIAQRPDKFNPAIKLELDGELVHRFVDFTGAEMHGETYDGSAVEVKEDDQVEQG